MMIQEWYNQEVLLSRNFHDLSYYLTKQIHDKYEFTYHALYLLDNVGCIVKIFSKQNKSSISVLDQNSYLYSHLLNYLSEKKDIITIDFKKVIETESKLIYLPIPYNESNVLVVELEKNENIESGFKLINDFKRLYISLELMVNNFYNFEAELKLTRDAIAVANKDVGVMKMRFDGIINVIDDVFCINFGLKISSKVFRGIDFETFFDYVISENQDNYELVHNLKSLILYSKENVKSSFELEGKEITFELIIEQSKKYKIVKLTNNINSNLFSDSHFKSVIDNNHELLIFAIDNNFKYLDFNDQYKNYIKSRFNKDLKFGDTFHKVHANRSSMTKISKAMHRVKTGASFDQVEEYYDSGVHKRIWRNFYSPIYSTDSSFSGMVCLMIEITCNRCYDNFFEDNLLIGNTLIKTLPDLVLVTDKNGLIYLHSDFNGYFNEFDAVGRNLSDFLSHDLSDKFSKSIKTALKSNNVTSFEFVQEFGNDTKYFEVRTCSIDSVRILHLIRNVTESKKNELELSDKQEELSAIIKAAPIGIVSIYSNLIIRNFNQKFSSMVGESVKINKTTIDEYIANFWEILKNYKSFVNKPNDDLNIQTGIEVELLCKNTKSIPAFMSINKYNDNKSSYYLITLLDLSKLKSAQKRIVQSEKLASLGQLMSNIAHEINTPLSVIKSSAEIILSSIKEITEKLFLFIELMDSSQVNLLKNLILNSLENDQKLISTNEERRLKRNLSENLKENGLSNIEKNVELLINFGVSDYYKKYIDLLKQSHNSSHDTFFFEISSKLSELIQSVKVTKIAVERGIHVIKALNNYSYIESNLTLKKTNIIQSIETALILFQNKLKKDVKIIREYKHNPEIPCYTEDLIQVWVNLISNALDSFNKRGTLKILVDMNDDFVNVEIKDNGCGIKEDDIDRIFDPFYTTKPRGEGTGLGLDIVKKIVYKHKGDIIIQSQVGKGTTFSILLPVNI